MNRPIDHVLEQLDGDVKGNGSGFLTFCPAHDDRNNPSLAVSEAEDGRVLLHCFVGCETTDILEALSLEMKDLFPSKKRKQKKTPSPVGDGESNGCTVAHVSEGGEATKKVNEAEIGCADKKPYPQVQKKVRKLRWRS
jgi:hypothetical protein